MFMAPRTAVAVRRREIGRAEFVDLTVKSLSSRWAEVHGRYHLYRKGEYGNATGLFTILMENTPRGWKILHDHTSAVPAEKELINRYVR